MSGFVAFLGLDGAPADTGWLASATAYLAFRGPDERRTQVDGPAGLGHAQLRTTFESAAEHQPLSLDGRVWLAADARVDGREELVRKLRARGREVADGAPDAALILHAYHAWGAACVDHLIGDLAFALWDGRERRLLCARDRFGARPLYFARAGESLLVGNTLDTLRLHPGVPGTLDEERIAEHLLFGLLPPSDATTFAAIRRLRPAHLLTARGGRVEVRRYWSPPEAARTVRCKDPAEYVERFRTLLDAAVGDRLRTGAVATHLSGGMDSASIAATASRLSKERGLPLDLRAYTMVFERLMPDDEGELARQVADHCGIPVERLPIDDFTLREPPGSPGRAFPEPWGLPGQLAFVEIAERASRFARVVLMGFGGDPLLYSRRQSPAELWRDGHRALALRRLAGPLARAVRLRPVPPGPAPLPQMPGWLDPSFARRVDAEARWRERIGWLAAADQRRWMALAPLWETIFTGNDPAYTRTPVRPRWPFFDLRLLEYMETVPPLPWCRAKHLLREATRGTLPEAVRLRGKAPLERPPLAAALESAGVPGWMRELASAPELAPFVDPKGVARLLDGPPGGQPRELLSLGPLLSLAHWLRHQRPPVPVPWI